jgi:signal transduction histidine kinase
MKPKVLLVDDEKLNLLTFEAFLADDDYELHSVDDGTCAVELARAISPDIILLDVMMPGVDGFTVCRTIRQDPLLRHVPIIIVTALHDTASRLEGLRAGADDFVTKPCSRDEIRARVRTIVSLNRFRTIAEQRARYERLYDLAPVGIVMTDDGGVVLSANPDAEKALATASGRTLVKDSLYARFEGDDVAVVQSAVAAAIAGWSWPQRDVRQCGANGERVLRIRVAGVTDEGARRAMLIFADVTAEAEAKAGLERMNRELDAAVQARTRQLEDANALLLSYASFVSHDLRSPLAVMKGYLSMVQEGAVPLAASGKMIEGAYKATIMMEQLVRNILQLAHDEHSGSHEGGHATDPAPIVRHVWSHVSGLFPHSRREFLVGPLPKVGVSALLVERVFYNLLTNAAKYSASRADVLIEVGSIDTPTGPALYVRDNGVGFDARDADRLFREFSRLSEPATGGGLGLGLSLVARLIRTHGGRIWAEGKAGEGATFYVQFGSHAAAPPAASEAHANTA